MIESAINHHQPVDDGIIASTYIMIYVGKQYHIKLPSRLLGNS